MPNCSVDGGDHDGGVRLFYSTYGCGSVKILLIIGLAGTLESWSPQLQGPTGTNTPNDADVGGSFVPVSKAEYS